MSTTQLSRLKDMIDQIRAVKLDLEHDVDEETRRTCHALLEQNVLRKREIRHRFGALEQAIINP